MSERTIAIDRITIRCRGIDPDIARAASVQLSGDLAVALDAATREAREGAGAVDSISVSTSIRTRPSATELRGVLVQSVARAVAGALSSPVSVGSEATHG